MAVEDLPREPFGFTRDELEQQYKRDYSLINPEADVTSGQPDLDARLNADQLLPIYADIDLVIDGINEDASVGTQMDRVGARIKLPRGGSTGASGYVTITAAAGGANITKDVHQLINLKTRLRYVADETVHRENGESVRVRSLDVGPNTDVDPGVVLQWTNPPPGIGQFATVTEQGGERGLTGGALDETDPHYLLRIRQRKGNPPAGDNVAELVDAIEKTPGVPVEQVFVWKAPYGPGSTAYTFTVLPPSAGASRIPTEAQLQKSYEWIVSQFPGDAGYFPLLPSSQPVTLAFYVAWVSGTWFDSTPWPELANDEVVVADVTSATEFELEASSGGPPIVGSTIAFWDATEAKFRKKTVLTVAGTGPWSITCDTTNSASDTVYIPQVGQLVSPWADNLDRAAAAVLAHMGKLGPGELFDLEDLEEFLAEGRSRVRWPRAPKAWPYEITTRVLTEIDDLPEVLEAVGFTGLDAVANPALPPNQLELTDLAFYADYVAGA